MNAPPHLIPLLIATRNSHKVDEIRTMLGGGFHYLTLNDFPGAPNVVEDAANFAGNAKKKAMSLAGWLAAGSADFQFPISHPAFVLADDSGLEVDALNGEPGVHSARFAALDSDISGNSSDRDNNAKLLRLLKEVPPQKRAARFRCVLALTPILPTPIQNSSPVCYAGEFELATELFEGACAGRINFGPRGINGFGYDPLFLPDGFEQTFAELGEAPKNQLSHRARALAKLRVWMESHAGERGQ